MTAGWTQPADLRAQLQKLWEQGLLLTWLVTGESPFPIRLVLRTPSSRECSERLPEVRAWSQSLAQAARHGLRFEMREWRHPVLGRNELQQQAWMDRPEDAWRWLGQQATATHFQQVLAATSALQPLLLPWLARKPLVAAELAGAWAQLLDLLGWMQAHPRPSIYVRQLDLPGVDTKFIERHQAVLSELLDLVLPAQAVDAGASGALGFARRYGFLERPRRVRLRVLDPACSMLGSGSLEDLEIDAGTLIRLRPRIERVFVTENEVNFLAFPGLPRSVVLFGGGYGLSALTATPWLRDADVHYWGDLDTHGFAILDELRAGLPHARSLLMDRETLLAHRAQWVEEPKPTLRELPRLTVPERALYDELRWKRIAPHPVRLEQERLGFGWVQAALARVLAHGETLEPWSCPGDGRVRT